MTDQQERAEQVIRDVHKELPDTWLGGRQRYVLVEAITSALADAERGAYENAAKVCEVEALIDDERGYYGKEMAKAIRAKATE